jgi:erythronate-4-phosphate dehydrogenase
MYIANENSKPIKILADASLSGLSEQYTHPFELTLYHNHKELLNVISAHDVLLCRSTLQVDELLLNNTPIRIVATASSGIDHIDTDYLKQHDITLFDAKGSNACAVADYVMMTLEALNELKVPYRKKAGVIGVGEVGTRVVKRLQALDWDIRCFDPIKEQKRPRYDYCSLHEIATCDVIFIHPNLHDKPPFSSRNLINTDFLAKLNPGTILINAARGGIVDEEALLAAPQAILYCTDVYCNEPSINPKLVHFATVCTPHIAGHTIEAKFEALEQLSRQLHQYYGLQQPLCSLSPCPSSCSQMASYNPLIDTHLLKASHDKKLAFLMQRKAHHRHEI